MTEVYRHYDAAGVLLYVGCAFNTWSRMVAHRCKTEWASRVSRTIIDKFSSREVALEVEDAAINNEKPMYNYTLVPGKGRWYRPDLPPMPDEEED